jgi:hypothetical protein
MMKKILFILLMLASSAWAGPLSDPNLAALIRDIATIKTGLVGAGTVKSIVFNAPLTGGAVTNTGTVGLGSVGFSNISTALHGHIATGSNVVYYCNAGVSVGNLCRGNGCSCVAGTWIATSLKID